MRPDYVGELIPFQEGVQGVRAINQKRAGYELWADLWGQRKIARKRVRCSM